MQGKRGWLQPFNGYPKEYVQMYRWENSSKHYSWTTDVIARGAGMSYGDAALPARKGVVTNMLLLKNFLSFNPERLEIKIESGVSIENLLYFLVPKGYTLPVLPGTSKVSVGGAIASDVHGKNHPIEGSFGCHVKEIVVEISSGERKICSESNNSDLFWATIGGMGLTGIIIEATISIKNIETSYMEVGSLKVDTIEHLMELFEQSSSFSFKTAWIDQPRVTNNRFPSIMTWGKYAHKMQGKLDFSKKNRQIRMIPDKSLICPLTILPFNYLYRYIHKNTSSVQTLNQFFHPLDTILGWNRLYGKQGFLQYQCSLPKETVCETVPLILMKLKKKGFYSALSVLKRFGSSSKGMMSFPQDSSYTLAIDIALSSDFLFPLLRELDNIVLDCEGRIYLAKDARVHPNTLWKMYPRVEEFLKIKSKFDPQGCVRSRLAERLELI